MIITLDARALILWSSIRTEEHTLARLDHLLTTVPKGGAILLPTPAIAELLVKTDQATDLWLEQLRRKSSVRVGPFDLRAAAECACMHRQAQAGGQGKRGSTKPGEAYQKIKVDRQIIAIAKVHGSELIVTDDDNLASTARSLGIRALGIDDLELPASARQGKFAFEVEDAAKAAPVVALPQGGAVATPPGPGVNGAAT